MSWYPWVVVAHVFFVIVALGAHGVSAYTMLRVRVEPDRARLAALLDLSQQSLGGAGIGLLIAVLVGILAAIMGGHFSRLWPWVSIVVVVLVFGLMTPFAGKPLNRVRAALGMPGRGTPPESVGVSGSDEELAAARAAVNPLLPTLIGLGGILMLVWLMEMKPF